MQLIIHIVTVLDFSKCLDLSSIILKLIFLYVSNWRTPPYYTVIGLVESSLAHIKVNGRIHVPFSDRTELFKTGGSLKYYVWTLRPPWKQSKRSFFKSKDLPSTFLKEDSQHPEAYVYKDHFWKIQISD